MLTRKKKELRRWAWEWNGRDEKEICSLILVEEGSPRRPRWKSMSTKNTKMEMHEEEIMDEDRLSDLPDSIILHILSFLETKFSVRTCLLSPRWKCLWASVPDLNFSVSTSNKMWFKRFVRRVLACRDDIPVNNCFLQYWGFDRSFTRKVINYVVSHGVKHFGISLAFPPFSF